MQTAILALAIALHLVTPVLSQQRPTATSPHVRVIAGNTCGSGTICGTNPDGCWVLTNAHVTGTALGRAVSVDIVGPNPNTRWPGTTMHTGFSSTKMVDYSIVWVPTLECPAPMQLIRTAPQATPFATRGSPRCVWPQVTKTFADPQRYGQDLLTGTPTAIGGQSGSAIYDNNRDAIALLTWSINGRAGGQTTHKLWIVATTQSATHAEARPAGLEELQDGTERPETEDAIQTSVSSPIRDLPIWKEPAPTEPPPAPPTDPTPPCKCCCPSNPTPAAIDWARLITLILEIIKLFNQTNTA